MVKVTVDDPKAYTKPWTVTLKQRIVVDAELIDEICLENEQFVKHTRRLAPSSAEKVANQSHEPIQRQDLVRGQRMKHGLSRPPCFR